MRQEHQRRLPRSSRPSSSRPPSANRPMTGRLAMGRPVSNVAESCRMSTRLSRSVRAMLVGLGLLVGCTAPATSSPSCPSAEPSATTGEGGSLMVVGVIVTLDEPSVAEAVLIQDGTVAAVGPRDEVVALACDGVLVIDIGDGVAYPGFIDSHAHWIGDREHYGMDSPEAAMDAALIRGWTSISEQWVDPDRLEELETLAADKALPMRVDAYLALNAPAPSGERLGDWYAGREPAEVDDHLRVQGVKITLDNGWGAIFHWDAAELAETTGRANEAGWQV